MVRCSSKGRRSRRKGCSIVELEIKQEVGDGLIGAGGQVGRGGRFLGDGLGHLRGRRDRLAVGTRGRGRSG